MLSASAPVEKNVEKPQPTAEAVCDALSTHKPTSTLGRFKHWIQDRDYHVWVMSLGEFRPFCRRPWRMPPHLHSSPGAIR